LQTKIGLGKTLLSVAASPLPKAFAVGENKKPRKLSVCGAQAFVAFNSRLVWCGGPGFIPEISPILLQAKGFVNIFNTAWPKISLTVPKP
jgi:hypothetical protein